MDIELQNVVSTLMATQNVTDDLNSFAKDVFDLSKKQKPIADDALKSLGTMLGEGRI
jgi:hypothetical protein